MLITLFLTEQIKKLRTPYISLDQLLPNYCQYWTQYAKIWGILSLPLYKMYI